MSGRTLNIDVPYPELVDTDEQAQDFLVLCLRKIERQEGDFIGFDTETKGKKIPITVGNKKPLDWMSDTVTFWSLSFFDTVENRYRRWCIRGEHFQYFAPVLENPLAWFAGWNIKYDAHVSWNMGINLWNANLIDGLALAGLHDENRMSQSLKACAPDWCGLHMTKFHDLFGTIDTDGNKLKEFETDLRTLPVDLVADYASYDAYAHLITVNWLVGVLTATPTNRDGGNLWDYFLNFERDITEILWRMERRGIPVDRPYLKSQIPRVEAEIDSNMKEAVKLSGNPNLNIGSPVQLAKFFFTSKELGGLGLAPIKLTKGGKQASVDVEVLTRLEETGTDLVRHIMRCRKVSKIKSTYLDALLELAEYFDDHRIHPNFNQMGARTGRFSTDVPNSQNFPKPDRDEFGIRKAFTAPPGYILAVGDYEQLEMRIMACMAQDSEMIRAIREGKDLHSFTVSRMTPGVTYEEAVEAKKSKEPTERQRRLKRLRQDMKAVGFGIIYGAGPGKIGEEIDIPDQEIRDKLAEKVDDNYFLKRVSRKQKNNPLLSPEKAAWVCAKESIAAEKIAAYFETFPGVKQYIEAIPEECRQSMEWDFWGKPRRRPAGEPEDGVTFYDWDIKQWIPGAQFLTRTGHAREFGFVRTFLDRYRRLENINHPNYKFRGEAERQSVNTCIQGSAADIIKGAMRRIEFSPTLNALGVEIINQVHDELVILCLVETAEEALVEIRECMEHPFHQGEEAMDVLLPVDLKLVDNWAAAKD